jgi:nucleoside-diphosphate-sugar epimerase
VPARKSRAKAAAPAVAEPQSRGRLLLTGAAGFIGRTISPMLAADGWELVPVTRRSGIQGAVLVPDIGPNTDWTEALKDCKAVVHLAARVHVPRERRNVEETLHRTTNTEGTLALARAAAAAGVKRFVFISTAKVYGEGRAQPYTEADRPEPKDAYARSKLEAERGLTEIAARTGLEVVILRPPLVYGPGVKANFLSLLRIVDRGWPLPLGGIRNKRSFVSTTNLGSAIVLSLIHPDAPGKVFNVTDGEDLSTPELIRRMAVALGRPARLIPVPTFLMGPALTLAGRRAAYRRVAASLALDSTAIRKTLNWQPPQTTDAGLAEVVWFWR